MAETFGALAGGLVNHRPGLRFAGVLANRVGSARHAELLQRGLAQAPGATPRWLGTIARQPDALPARQLGLVAAPQLPDTEARLTQLADAVAGSALGQLPWSEWQAWRVNFEAPHTGSRPVCPGTSENVNDDPCILGHFDSTLPQRLAGRTIAVAHDAAFSFVYPANLACLQTMGARLALFSPLAGDNLPPCDALWLPGGYPELHAPALARATRLRDQIARHVADGKPVWAECGGMVALAQRIDWPARSSSEPLWGLLPATATQHERLQGLGMQAWRTPHGLLRGHGFHYSSLSTELAPIAHTQRLRGETELEADTTLEAVYAHGPIHASYFHAWFPSNPRAIAALLGGDAGP
jgi:cobyrinic acid a,c-diamide synthase